jgi:predicted secreted protein
MAESGEMRGFVFAITFIVLFSTLLATIPVGLQGEGGTGNELTPLDPTVLYDFADGKNWTKSDMTLATMYTYTYTLGSHDWLAIASNVTDLFFSVAAKEYWWILWLGGLDFCEYIAPDGTNRGIMLSIDEIIEDAEDGEVRYNLVFETTGNSGGGFVFFWNETLYPNPYTAWSNDALNLLHGVGLEVTGALDVGSLLLGLLFLQLPQVPLLVNALLATPVWACIIFIAWFIIKEMIPFI